MVLAVVVVGTGMAAFIENSKKEVGLWTVDRRPWLGGRGDRCSAASIRLGLTVWTVVTASPSKRRTARPSRLLLWTDRDAKGLAFESLPRAPFAGLVSVTRCLSTKSPAQRIRLFFMQDSAYSRRPDLTHHSSIALPSVEAVSFAAVAGSRRLCISSFAVSQRSSAANRPSTPLDLLKRAERPRRLLSQ